MKNINLFKRLKVLLLTGHISATIMLLVTIALILNDGSKCVIILSVLLTVFINSVVTVIEGNIRVRLVDMRRRASEIEDINDTSKIDRYMANLISYNDISNSLNIIGVLNYLSKLSNEKGL